MYTYIHIHAPTYMHIHANAYHIVVKWSTSEQEGQTEVYKENKKTTKDMVPMFYMKNPKQGKTTGNRSSL